MLLADIFQQYYLLEHPEIARGTVQNINASIRAYSRFLGRDATLTDFSKKSLYDFMAWMSELGYAPKSINNKRGDLITLWYSAHDEGMIGPVPRIRKRKEPKRLPVVWTLDEIRRIYAATDGAVGSYRGVSKKLIGKLAISILWDTGCRVGTLRKAKLADVNLSTGAWFVPAENLKGSPADRIFRLHPNTIAILKETLAVKRERLVPLPLDKNTMYEWAKNLLTRADLPHDRLRKFQCIRRTAETQAAAKMGIGWAAAAIGHTEEVARKYYVNPLYLDSPNLIDALPRLTD
jgi:integrase